MIELSPNFSQFHRSGRWTQTDSGSLIASWASASISFILTSSSLSIRLGPQTTQKYTSGGSSTALVCSISNLVGSHDHHDQYHLSTPSITQVLTFSDVEPGLLSLFDRLGDGEHKLVEITLVDWSYVLELASVVVDNVGTFPFCSLSLLPESLYADAERQFLTSWRPFRRHLICLLTLACSS